jgi:hypothetical protein
MILEEQRLADTQVEAQPQLTPAHEEVPQSGADSCPIAEKFHQTQPTKLANKRRFSRAQEVLLMAQSGKEP